MVGMPMRLMRLGSTGGIPKPLLFLSNINDSGEKLWCCISVFVCRNIQFLLSYFKDFGGGNTKYFQFLWFCLKAYDLYFKKVVRLDGCVAFSQIEPKTPNLDWELVVVAFRANGIRKSRKCYFSHYEIDDFEGRDSHFSRESMMYYVLKYKL